METKKENSSESKKSINILGLIKKLLLTIVLLPVFAIFILQIPSVQSWTAKKITNFLSDKTGMDIEVGNVSLNLVKGLVLNNLYVSAEQDTMVKIAELDISLRKNLLYLFNNTLDMSEIEITDFSLNIVKKKGESLSNLDKLIQSLSSQNSKKNTNKSIFSLNLENIKLNTINIAFDDENKGKSTNVFLRNGAIKINLIDLYCNEINVEQLLLNELQLNHIVYDEDCTVSETPLKNIEEISSVSDSSDSYPYKINVKMFRLHDAEVSYQNNLMSQDLVYPDMLDLNHFKLSKIELTIDDFLISEEMKLNMKLRSFTFQDDKGFELRSFVCDSIHIDQNTISLPGFVLETNNSILKDKIRLNFADFNSFSDFANNVILNIEFTESKLYLGDITHFIKALNASAFFKNNSTESLNISGRYFGKIINIAGRDVDITMGDKLSLAGSFNTRDIHDPDNTVLNVKLDRFRTSMRNIKKLVPNFNPPPNFYKIGNINFTGRFDGYLEDFVAYGKLRTDIGVAEMDMRLDITQGTSRANYSGQLNLINFNLGRWSDNADFGLLNFNSKVQDGRGLTLNTLKTDLIATVKSLNYKNYDYKNFIVEGQLEKNIFNGSLHIEDPNINFLFNGSLEYLDNLAVLNFKSEVKRIDLKTLNLSEKALAFSGIMDIDIRASNINDLIGKIDIGNLIIETQDTSYTMEAVNLESKLISVNQKQLIMNSDLGRINIEGDYDLPNIVNSVKKIITSNYPYLTKTWKFEDKGFTSNQQINFDIQISDSKNFLDLAGLKNTSFNKLNLKGRIDSYKNEISISTTVPSVKFGNESFKNLQLLVTSDYKSGAMFIHIDSTFALGRKFNPVDIQTNMIGDTIDVQISTNNIIKSFDDLDLRGQFIPHPKGYELSIQDNDLNMFGGQWKFNKGNKIILGEKYFDINNLEISDGNRKLTIHDIDNKGLRLGIRNFELDVINSIVNYDKMYFGGLTNIDVELSDVFENEKNLNAVVNIPQFTINKDPYGVVNIFVTKDGENPLEASAIIGDIIAMNATYAPSSKTLNAKAKLKSTPLYILQYLLKDGITQTEGYADAEININGALNDLKINGEGTLYKGKTKLIYTGVVYSFDNQKIKLDEKVIDLTGSVIRDANNNIGLITGGLTHNAFRDFGVNATISGNNVIALNTTKADNPNYYGFGIGNMTAIFSGSFENVDMVINGVTGPGTKLFIPVGNTQTSAEVDFIKFFKKDELDNSTIEDSNAKIEGLSIEVNLTLTPDAELSIIFDESRGDIIRGNGRGNLQMFITRTGDFDIFGEYEIESGEYLFTVALLPVAKPFVVSRGGIITWTGDPVNTTLNIEANYRMRTPVRPFIEEYLALASTETISLANQRSEVDLRLKLGGTLYQPDIKFDLAFQNLVGELANFTDSKLRLLKNNELELNSQVLGLIVFNSFLPSNRVSDAFGVGSLQSAGINTLSEFVSSQLSLYLTSLLNTALEENGLIAGIDFEVGLRNNALAVGSAAADNRNIFPDEIEFRMKNRFKFLDERLSLNLGGNYVFENQGLAVNQILPDFALELILTKDRKLKARLYGKYDLDVVAINSLRQKYGLGLGYRTEFGSMLDFEQKLVKGVGELIQN